MDFLKHTLLPLHEVHDFQQRLGAPNLPWRDGRLTAGAQAALVKQNYQLDPNAELALAITLFPGQVLEILMDGMLIILFHGMVGEICLLLAF